MDDNKVKWTRKVRRYLRDAFSWLDTGLMLNALLIMDITFAGCFGADDAPLRAEIAEKDKITAYMEFTSFAFCDTIAADESEAGG